MATPDVKRGGQYRSFGGYRCFEPAPWPPNIRFDHRLTNTLSLADRALARLDGAAMTMPNPDLFVYAFMRQEALLSSQIEGTQASLEDLFEFEAEQPNHAPSLDVAEIVNYLDAMNWGLTALGNLPVSLRLVRGLHARLLASGRGSGRQPGSFRSGQNHIGPPGCGIEDATFVPPAVPIMGPALTAWEHYLHDRELPVLIRCALLHAQFETIHPFWDGNGRVGRMLITLKLCEEEVLTRPLLYLSLFFKTYRDEYYSRLQGVRDNGNWEGWLLFFLRGVTVTSRSALQTARAIMDLRETVLAQVQSGSRSSNPVRLAAAMFKQPYMTTEAAAALVGSTRQTGINIINMLETAGWLRQVGSASRGKVYAFRPYIDLLHTTGSDLSKAIGSIDIEAPVQAMLQAED